MSRLETLTGPDGRTLTLERGPLGRVEAVRRTDGEATRFEYDASGRLARVIDPAEHVQEYTYDEFNRLVATLDPRQRVTRYAYGLMSDLRSLTDAEGRTTEFVPDAFGRVERTINPLNQVERYEYYPSGRLRLREDRNGIQTVYTYDPLGRLVGKTYSDGTPAWSAVYEDAARRVTYANGTATVVRVLDEAGRLVSETSTVSGSGTSSTVTYTYNTDGQRETVSLDGSQIASYTYVDGFLDTIDSGEAQPFDFDYDELGRRTTLTYPNGVVTSYSYHPTLGWLTGIQAVKDAASILDVSYDHDLIGNRTEKSVDGLTEAYEYDAKSQLVAVQRTSPEARSWEYEYDGVGNRLVERVDDMPSTWTYDDANRVLARAAGGSVRVAGTTSEAATVTLDGQPATSVGGQGFEGEIEAPAGTSTFEVQATDASGNPRTSTYEFDAGTGSATYDYDANGNLIEKVEGGETWTYEWNAEGQLTRVLKDSVEVASFRYGPLGRRVERVAGSVTHSYIYDGIDILRASIDDGSVATTYTYVHGPGLDEPVVREEDSGTRSYYHADGLGSVVATTDAAGAVMSQREYDAWGNIEVGSADSGYAFTGREWDPETGLVYYRGRYHDPASGRFLSEDPLGAGGGGSRYAYVKNNPAVFIDPLGLQACLYDIPSGRMTCSDPGGNVVHDSRDWVSGLGGPCQNNPTPDCVSQKDVGPLPPGTYTSTGKPGHRPASTTRRNLTPDPSTKTHGRSAFQTHGCGNTATCSIGCAAQPDAQVMNDFNGFVDANPNTRVDATGYTGVGGPGLAGYVLARLRDLF
jgi:RHS repeat-associated protein